jgi:hypothetical protein
LTRPVPQDYEPELAVIPYPIDPTADRDLFPQKRVLVLYQVTHEGVLEYL